MKPKAKTDNRHEPPDPSTLIQTVSADAQKTENWFFREQDKILDLASNCFLSAMLHLGFSFNLPHLLTIRHDFFTY